MKPTSFSYDRDGALFSNFRRMFGHRGPDPRRGAVSVRPRPLRLEELEDRRLLAVTWVVNTIADASTWNTSDSIVTLREALARSGDGDEILFDATLKGRSLTLSYGQLEITKSVNIDATSLQDEATEANGFTVNAYRRNRVFNIAADLDVRIAGLNIVNGKAENNEGGGIRSEATLTIIHCHFSSNSADYGSGIYSFHGAMNIVETTFAENIGNTETSFGGALYVYMGSAEMTDCVVENNRANTGGGIDNYSANLTMTRCIVRDNATSNEYTYGGGIFNLYGQVTMMDCKVIGNSSQNIAGGIYNFSGTMILTNCLVAENSAKYTGGGIENFGALTLTQTTVSGNTATDDYTIGAGIMNYTQGSLTACNAIIAGNTAGQGGQNVDMNIAGVLTGYNVLTSVTEWNEIENLFIYNPSLPLFLDAASGDYSLAPGSQAADSGYNGNAVYPTGNWIEHDLAGKTRIVNEIVDLGAYELQSAAKLDAPTQVRTSSAGANRVRVTWNLVENAEEYWVAYSTDQTNWMTLVETGFTAVVTGLTYGSQVYYKVMAVGDGLVYANSDYSETVNAYVCPMDIDSDGFVGPNDRNLISVTWFTSSTSANWDERCDVDGDGFVGPIDRSYISMNWFKRQTSSSLLYPPARADMPDLTVTAPWGETVMTVPAATESIDILDVFPVPSVDPVFTELSDTVSAKREASAMIFRQETSTAIFQPENAVEPVFTPPVTDRSFDGTDFWGKEDDFSGFFEDNDDYFRGIIRSAKSR